MKRKLPLVFGALFLAFAATACEGPQGPEGPAGPKGDTGETGQAGADGTNALNTCSDCHTADPTIVAIEQQFALSAHGFGNYEVRADSYGTPCSSCHSSQGFVANATGTTADFSDGVASMNCRTCHQIHSTYASADFALTTTDPVTLRLTDNEIDVTGTDNPGSNLCANCHQSLSEATETFPAYDAAVTDSFEITSVHYGLHHGPQANFYQGELPTELLYGNAQGTTFSSHAGPSCLGCHMGLGDDVSDVGLDGVIAGEELFHNFTPGEVVCNACHTNDVSDEGFDHNGVRTAVDSVLTTLGACLEAEGVIAVDTTDGSWHPHLGFFPEPYVAAYLMANGVREDGSMGAHNPGLIKTLLNDAATAMDTNSADPACAYTSPF